MLRPIPQDVTLPESYDMYRNAARIDVVKA